MTAQFIGLDLETSGSDIDTGAVPIQLGIATITTEGNPAVFDSKIHWPVFHGPPAYDTVPTWSIEAEAVHNIPKEDLLLAPRTSVVESNAYGWLSRYAPATSRAARIPVGWNIAGFDMPFVRRYLPGVQAGISYRSIDLNAVCFSIGAAGIRSPLGGVWRFKGVKGFVKDLSGQKAEEATGRVAWHDAGFDALAGLYAWHALQAIIRHEDPRQMEFDV